MRYVVLAGVVALGSACGGESTVRAPSAPTALPASPVPAPAGPYKLSGFVYEATANGRRALPGVPLDVSAEYQSWPPQITSDTEGRYETSRPAGSAVKVAAEYAGYSQPCRVGVVLNTDTTVDVYLVPNAVLATSGIPVSMPILEPTLFGRVVERTPDGLRPMAGVRVTADFSGGSGWAPSATTVTEATGLFTLCGVTDASGFGVYLYASKAGYSGFANALTTSSPYEIELTPVNRSSVGSVR